MDWRNCKRKKLHLDSFILRFILWKETILRFIYIGLLLCEDSDATKSTTSDIRVGALHTCSGSGVASVTGVSGAGAGTVVAAGGGTSETSTGADESSTGAGMPDPGSWAALSGADAAESGATAGASLPEGGRGPPASRRVSKVSRVHGSHCFADRASATERQPCCAGALNTSANDTCSTIRWLEVELLMTYGVDLAAR